MAGLVAAAVVVALWSPGARAAEADPCTALSAQVARACTGADAAVATKFAGQCRDFSEKLKTLDAKLEALTKECAKTGTTTSKRAGRKGRGDQSLAPKDTSTLADESAGLMASCGFRMQGLADEYRALEADAGKQADGAGGSATCSAKAKAAYRKIQSRAQERAAKADQLAGQYVTASSVAKDVADRNNGNSDSMKGSGSDAGKGSGSGSGGGSPMQSPQQQQKQQQQQPQKTPQQILAEQRALRQAQCQNLIATYNNAIVTCNLQHRCQPEIARVKDVCDAYNACIAAAAPVPGDCQGAPAPAQPK